MKRLLMLGIFFSVFTSNMVFAHEWQALPDKAPEPEDNPTTAEKIELGRLLYFDPRFSSTGTVSCNSCHNLMADSGRFDVTGKEADKQLFKVPTPRNVALTAPYLHNGLVKTLDEAVRVMARLQLTQALSNEQVDDIVAFLNALTGDFPEQVLPRQPATSGWTLVDPQG